MRLPVGRYQLVVGSCSRSNNKRILPLQCNRYNTHFLCCTLFSVSVLLLPEEASEGGVRVVVMSQAVVFISSMNSAVSSSLNSAPSVFSSAEELNENTIEASVT